MVIQYCGQTHGRRDDSLFRSKFFVGGKLGKRKLLGNVLGTIEIEKQKTRMFIMVVKKTDVDQPIFATKNALCSYYGWSSCDDYFQGITRHRFLN
jgi:hypothetical protein